MNGAHGLRSPTLRRTRMTCIFLCPIKYKLLFRMIKLLYYSIKHGLSRESYILTSNKEHTFRRLVPQQTNSQIFFVERMSGGRGTAKRLSRILWTQHKFLPVVGKSKMYKKVLYLICERRKRQRHLFNLKQQNWCEKKNRNKTILTFTCLLRRHVLNQEKLSFDQHTNTDPLV